MNLLFMDENICMRDVFKLNLQQFNYAKFVPITRVRRPLILKTKLDPPE